MKSSQVHEPVLLQEAVDLLHLEKRVRGGKPKVIDATVGAGGHAVEIIARGGTVLGIDADSAMLEIARENLEKACPAPESLREPHFKLVKGNFRDLGKIARQEGYSEVDAVIFDLGVSAFHFGKLGRGFSFQDESEALDMRLDPATQGVTAKDLLAGLREDQLREMLETSLSAAEAKKLAKRIVAGRTQKPIVTVGDLIKIGKTLRPKGSLHPATRVFLAIRIAVNSELENLKQALPQALNLLVSGGRLAVISFHSGEDRIVKNLFRDWEKDGKVVLITKNPVRPSPAEVLRNPRSRSAVLRVVEKKGILLQKNTLLHKSILLDK